MWSLVSATRWAEHFSHPGVGMVSLYWKLRNREENNVRSKQNSEASGTGNEVERIDVLYWKTRTLMLLWATHYFSSFHNTGMVCAATGRYYIHEKLYDEFVEKFIAKI